MSDTNSAKKRAELETAPKVRAKISAIARDLVHEIRAAARSTSDRKVVSPPFW